MHLLGIDLGLRTGLALYDRTGTLLYARCQRVNSKQELKVLARSALAEVKIEHVFMEGDRSLGDLWQKECAEVGALPHRVPPETWRDHLFFPREWRDKKSAKASAQKYAQNVIAKLAQSRPTSLRTDAAEAVLIGYYGLSTLRWVDHDPRDFIRHPRHTSPPEDAAMKPWEWKPQP